MLKIISQEERDRLRRHTVRFKATVDEDFMTADTEQEYLLHLKRNIISAIEQEEQWYNQLGIDILATKPLELDSIVLANWYSQNAGEKEDVSKVLYFEIIPVKN